MSAITRHDLQDLRRRVLLDCRGVDYGDIGGVEAMTGVALILDGLLAKLDGRPYIDGAGYRHPGDDGSWPEEPDENDYANPRADDFDPRAAQKAGH